MTKNKLAITLSLMYGYLLSVLIENLTGSEFTVTVTLLITAAVAVVTHNVFRDIIRLYLKGE